MRPRIFEITDPAQLEAIALPVRAEIVDLVSGLGPMSCKAIAEMLGSRRPAVHYQVKQLLDVGLLVPAGKRGSGRTEVELVDTPAREMRLNFDASSSENRARFDTYVRLALQRVMRLIKSSFASGRAVTRGSQRDTLVAQSTCRLTADQLEEVNRLIDLLIADTTPTEHRDEGTHYLLTIAIAPMESSK